MLLHAGTPAQRAAAIRRRKEIWEVLHPENQVGQLVPPEIGFKKPPPQHQAFASDTSTVTGESKRDINRHLSRADALGDSLAAVVGTSLDKGVELDTLKYMWKGPGAKNAPAIARSLLLNARSDTR